MWDDRRRQVVTCGPDFVMVNLGELSVVVNPKDIDDLIVLLHEAKRLARKATPRKVETYSEPQDFIHLIP